MKINYRTTQQIRSYADRLLPEQLAANEQEDRSSISLLGGQDPEVSLLGHEDEEIQTIRELVKGLLDEGFAPAEIAIFARLRDQLQRPRKALKSLKVASHDLEDNSPLLGSGIALGTMHRAKGLEFRAVLIVACDSKSVPLRGETERREDSSDRGEALQREASLLYVACTRARERLYITGSGEVSELLPG